jgi:hypothetical protein
MMRKKEAELFFNQEYLPNIEEEDVTSISSEWTKYLGWLFDQQIINLKQLESWNKPHRYNLK